MDFVSQYACADVIQAWGLCRDQAKWAELLATFAPEGEIAVSWFRGPFPAFVDLCRKAHAGGRLSKHHLFPSHVRVTDGRAVAETNVIINVRQDIDGVICDMTSFSRFLDRLVRRDGRWVILERACIYEQDRLDPVKPSEAFDAMMKTLDVANYPEAYRYMACRLVAVGRPLAMPVLRDGIPETAEHYARYDRWLQAG
jgi:hypothetical protein